MEHSETKDDIGRQIRLKRGKIRQKDFARLVNVHKDQLSRYERGKSVPGAEIFQRIMDFRKGDEAPMNQFRTSGVSESVVEYQVNQTKATELIENVKEILGSGDEVTIHALKASVKAFLQAVRTSKKNGFGDYGGK